MPPSSDDYDFGNRVGCVVIRKTKTTGAYSSIVVSEDPDTGRWMTICEGHSTTVMEDSLRNARASAADPTNFCDGCRENEPGDTDTIERAEKDIAWEKRRRHPERHSNPVTSLRHIGDCAVCTRRIKVRSGLLVHHGYQRPGYGYIIGDCYAVNMPPHELSSAAAKGYLRDIVLGEVARAEDDVKYLGAELPFPSKAPVSETKYGHRAWKVTPLGQTQTTRMTKDALSRLRVKEYDEENSKSRSDWDPTSYVTKEAEKEWTRVLKYERLQTAMRLQHWLDEKARVDGLISTWKPLPLQTVDEEVAKGREAKAAVDAEKKAGFDERKEELLASIRARIDSAVKNKNANALRTIFEDGYRKYQDLASRGPGGVRLKREEILSLMDRNNVWHAFGLLQHGEYVSGFSEIHSALKPWWEKGSPWPESLGGGKTKTPA